VGDGDLRAAFERELQQLGVRKRWEITGWMDSPYGYLRASRLSWLASLYESFGYVTLEAMALGVPTIGTIVAGTRDLIAHGRNGFLVRVGDEESLATLTLRCLDDKPLRETLAANARATAEVMSSGVMVEQTADLYRMLLARGRGLKPQTSRARITAT
jgi:glycosyltransferase involved in cell wall biosynthesis